MTNEKLAWLAGLWDGEGTITVFLTHREKGQEKYNASLILTNTDEKIISEATKILDELELRMHLFKRKPEKKEWKSAYQLTTRKLEVVKKFCEIFIPYLIGKKAQAELTLRFVNSRLKGKCNNYSEEEKTLCQQLKLLNRRGYYESSTTIRLTP
jgi:hypothetical protein